MNDDDANRLAEVALDLVQRVRDDDPAANGRWLANSLPSSGDWFQLCFVLAAAVPDDRSWRHLTEWARQLPQGPRVPATAEVMSWESIDARQVSQVERACDSWDDGASGTGASTPARTDRSSTSATRKEHRLMPNATYVRPACEPSRAVNHSGGASS